MNASSSSVWGKRLAVAGSAMQLAILLGVIGTIAGMMRAFEKLGTTGINDPSGLSAAIGEVLVSTAIGFAISFVGVILMGIALFGVRYRAEWFFWMLMLAGVIWLPFGLIFLLYGIMKRKEFTRSGDWTNLATPGAA